MTCEIRAKTIRGFFISETEHYHNHMGDAEPCRRGVEFLRACRFPMCHLRITKDQKQGISHHNWP